MGNLIVPVDRVGLGTRRILHGYTGSQRQRHVTCSEEDSFSNSSRDTNTNETILLDLNKDFQRILRIFQY